jgi:hypothetical protein
MFAAAPDFIFCSENPTGLEQIIFYKPLGIDSTGAAGP